MNVEQYREMVRALAKPGEDICAQLTPEKAHLLHMSIGICGEAGELIDAVKKHVVYNKQLDVDNVIEELGDMEFYMEGLRQALLLSREVALQANFEKLGKRYASAHYTDQAAQARADKELK